MTLVLIVDDEEQNLYLLQVLLQGQGYAVQLARNGIEALESARREPPDLIITDILMPGMDGFSLCRAWMADARLQHIPLVFYTATYTDSQDEVLALSLGAVRFIVKPTEPDAFIEIVHQVLDQHAARELAPPGVPGPNEEVFYQQYNQALIRKLEDKMKQLEEANRTLEIDIAARRRAEHTIRQRNEELTTLNQIGQSLSRLAEPAEILHLVAITIGRVLDNRNMCIALVDAATGSLAFPVCMIDGVEAPQGDRSLGHGIAEYVIRMRTPLFLPCGVPAALAERGIDSRGRTAECLLAVPVTAGDLVMGVIVVLDKERENAYDAHHLELLTTIATQAAGALENARLFAELRESLTMTTRLYEHSAHVLDATSLQETARLVTEAVRMGFAADACTIHLFGDNAGEEFRFSTGFSPTFHQETRARPQGLTARVRKSREPIIAQADELHPRVRAEGIQFDIALPLPGERDNIGALFVGFRRPRVFGRQDRELMSLFANHAALALKRSQLLRETQRRLGEMEAVNRISTALRAATTVEEMYPILLDEMLQAQNTDTGMLVLFDRERNELRRVAERGWVADLPWPPIRPGDGIVGHTFVTGQVYLAHDLAGDPHTHPAVRAHVPAEWSGLFVPIRTTMEVIGVLFAAVAWQQPAAPGAVQLLETIAGIAGNAIQRTRLHVQTELQVERLSALRTIDLAISATMELAPMLNVVLAQVTSQLHVDAAVVQVVNPQTQTLEYAGTRGLIESRVRLPAVDLRDRFVRETFLERRLCLVSDLEVESEHWARKEFARKEGFRSYVGMPLIAKGQVKGILELWQRSLLTPDPEWLEFLQMLAGQVAIAVDSAEMFVTLQRSNQELMRAYDTTIEGWSRALDLRDHETEGHSQRVAELTLRLAHVLGMRDQELVHVRRGALLHDIGKIAIPDSILLKPGPLTAEEWQVMRQHPVRARDLLSSIEFLRPSIPIPYYHHEKWDGTGYPEGLKGDAIPMAARVFAIVDVWDALRSDRPYRARWSQDKAREFLREQTGSHFEPQIVGAFLDLSM